MPRNVNGEYELPAGNPVVSGTIISTNWANDTMADLATALTNSLSRNGNGGMLAPFLNADGSEAAPGIAWANEPSTGLWRAGSQDMRLSISALATQRWSNNTSYLWRNDQWEEIITSGGGGGGTTINDLVVTGSFTSPGIDDNATSTAITIDASQNVGVGIDAPSLALEVSGSYDTAAFYRDADVDIVGTAANWIQFGAKKAGVYTPSATFGGTLDADGLRGTATIQTRTGGVLTPKVTIDSAGTTKVTGGFQAAQSGAGANATAIGENAGLTSQSAGAIAVGAAAGQITQGEFSVAVGNAAGYTGQGNKAVGVGSEAGKSNQGYSAVAIGNSAGTTSQGQRSVTLGSYSGETSQGEFSVAVGDSAGRNSQGNTAVAVGHLAGAENQLAGAIAVGLSAGTSGQQGNAIAIGEDAGTLNQQPHSIAIGTKAGELNQAANGIIINSSGVAVNNNFNNHIAIQSAANKYLYYNGTDSWKFTGGDVDVPSLLTTTGNLYRAGHSGIHFTTSALLALDSNANISDNAVDLGATNYRYKNGYFGGRVKCENGGLQITIGTWASSPRIESSGGGLGIGTSDANTLYLNTNNSTAVTIDTSNNLTAVGNVTAYSDERLKDDIQTLDGSKVYDMRGVSFTKDGEAGSGVIAQELQMVAPELVHEGEEYLSVAYGNLVGYLIEAVKDLKAEVEELKRAK